MTICSNVLGMNKHSAEDLVRRATAAFNSGKPDEARQLCEQGLSRQPGDPMLHHLLAAVLFSQGEIQPARGHVASSLANRPDNAAALLLAARIARAAAAAEGTCGRRGDRGGDERGRRGAGACCEENQERRSSAGETHRGKDATTEGRAHPRRRGVDCRA